MQNLPPRGLNKLPACPACSGPAKYLTTRTLRIFECLSCTLVFAEAEHDVIECHEPFWDHARATIDRQEAVAATMAGRRLALYEQTLGRPVASILEIGCGLAPWGRAFAGLGLTYVGVEYLPEVAEAARERTGLDIRAGTFPDAYPGCFDVVFCSQVLEHVRSPRPFLEATRKCGSLLHLDVPNQGSLVALIRRAIPGCDYGMLQPPYHLRAFTEASLRTLLKRCDFRVAMCAARRNDDPVFGQPGQRRAWHHRLAYAAAGAIGRGSLLAAIAH